MFLTQLGHVRHHKSPNSLEFAGALGLPEIIALQDQLSPHHINQVLWKQTYSHGQEVGQQDTRQDTHTHH